MPRFVDRVVIHARAGSGGNGCASIHREKFKPLGGPDGGNGGRGGSVVLVVDPQVHTLLDFHFHPHVTAPSGKPGMGSNRDGAAGANLEVKVPDGTGCFSEQGVVAPAADVDTRVELRAALTHQNLAGLDDLTAEPLDAQPLRSGITTVARAGRAFLVCHVFASATGFR